MSVVAALEFDDARTSGKTARQADRSHRRLGAGTDQTYHFQAGKNLAQQLGDFQFGCSRSAETKSLRSRVLYCLDHIRMAVADDHRAP